MTLLSFPISSRLVVRNRICLYRKQHTAILDAGSQEPIQLTTGHLARFASGAVVATQGDNAVLATCVYKPSSSPNAQGFVPLTVDYRQSAAAVGKIPTNYLRRELSQSDTDIIASRIIDRTVRPLFPRGWGKETQLVCKPLSLDEQGDGVILAVNAAATALHLSPIPFNGPVAAVRLALVEGKVMVNPSRDARRHSQLDMVLAGCRDRKTVMIEMDGEEISLDQSEEIFNTAFVSIDEMLASIERLRDEAGKEKTQFDVTAYSAEQCTQIEELAEERLYYILTDSTLDKIARDDQIKELGKDVADSLKVSDIGQFWSIYSDVVKYNLRKLILDSNLRCDGRGLTDFRPITISVDVYKKLHGSALFQRGQTQVFSTVTFDRPEAAFHPDSISQMLGAQRKKMFMHHYEFPSFATNEISMGRGVNRREIGHGALAEKALKHVIPNDFPYSIRLATQVLESNGSSSMASVCSGSLALFDAGVPLKNPVAGVAMGLVTGERPDEEFKILTDLLGIEDYAGDMDFKIAGTKNGFTAMQLDVKIGGLTWEQLSQALKGARGGIDFVLNKMAVMRDRPRSEFKPTVPIIESMVLEPYKRQILFRGGGFNAKQIEAETGVSISVEDDTHINLFAPNKDRLKDAKDILDKLLSTNDQMEFNFGQLINVEVVEMLERGIQVQIQGAARPIFVPNSQIHPLPVQHSTATGLKVGQKVAMQWLGRDDRTGQIRLSRRTLSPVDSMRAVGNRRK